MSGFLGADTQQLRAAAGSCQRADRSIAALSTQLESTVLRVQWEGADAEAFRTQWGAVRMRLENCGVLLGQRAKELETQAAEQDDASAGTAHGSGGPLGALLGAIGVLGGAGGGLAAAISASDHLGWMPPHLNGGVLPGGLGAGALPASLISNEIGVDAES